MPKLLYVEHDGTQHYVEAATGKSIMQNALDNMVPGILGDCGGCCTCATCHAYIAPDWLTKTGAPSEDETMMINGALQVRPNSRLTCQIIVTEALDGLRIDLPESQF